MLSTTLFLSILLTGQMMGDCHMDDSHMAHHMDVMNLVDDSLITDSAVQSGKFSDPATWGGKLPNSDAIIQIPMGMKVEYDLANSPTYNRIRVNGELAFSRTKSTLLNVETIVVMACGYFNLGTSDDPIPADKTATIRFRSNSPLSQTDDPSLVSRGLLSMGKVRVYGQVKDTFTQLESGASKGQTTLTLQKLPRNWKVGDKVILTGTEYNGGWAWVGADKPHEYQGTQDEVRYISAIDGKQVTLDQALSYNHLATKKKFNAYLANFSHNIVFENSTGLDTPAQQRGHIMMMSSDTKIYYSEVRGLGRTDKSRDIDDPVQQINGAPGYGTNPRGRYAIHFHRNGSSDPLHMTPAEVVGNSVFNSVGWGIVNHQSYVLIEDNAAYDVFGSAFVTEDGNEVGSFRRNIAIKGKGIDTDHNIKLNSTLHDFGRYGSGFWFQGRNIAVEDNVACGFSEAAFFWWHRSKAMDDPSITSIKPLVTKESLLSPFNYDNLGSDPLTIDDAPISLSRGNVACASFIGLRVVKGNPFQFHKLRSVFENWDIYNVQYGAEIEYTRYYTFKHFDIESNFGHTAFIVGNGSREMVVNDFTIKGFGTDFSMTDINNNEFFGPEVDTPTGDPLDGDILLIDVKVEDKSAPKIKNFNPVWHKIMSKDELKPEAQPSFTPNDQKVYLPERLSWDSSLLIYGTLEDSSGKRENFYPFKIYGPRAKQIKNDGYYVDSNGEPFILLKETVADRATGRDYWFYNLPVYIPASYDLSNSPNLGELPGYVSATLTATGESMKISKNKVFKSEKGVLIANESNLGSDQLQIHLPTTTKPLHGKLSITRDGTFNYLPDADFEGTDSFQYQLVDGPRLSNMVTVQLNVKADQPTSCAGDLTNDGILDGSDIQLAIDMFLSRDIKFDLNGDGILDLGDLSIFLAYFNSPDC